MYGVGASGLALLLRRKWSQAGLRKPESDARLDEIRGWARILCEHAEWGTHYLQNAAVGSDADLTDLRSAEREWIEQGVEKMRDAGCPEEDVSEFRVIKHFRAIGLPGINQDHAKLRDQIAERVDRLVAAAGRLEERVRRPQKNPGTAWARDPVCRHPDLAMEAIPSLPDDAANLLRSLHSHPRQIGPTEKGALDALKAIEAVWCLPYKGDWRTNTYHVKKNLHDSILDLLGP